MSGPVTNSADLELLEAPIPFETREAAETSEENDEFCMGRSTNGSDETDLDAVEDGSCHPAVLGIVSIENRIVDLLTRMVLTHERFLRATKACRVIQCAGRVLRDRRPGAVSFAHSRSVEKIGTFISHSWQASAGFKILSLQLFFNWKYAVLLSNVAATLGLILFSVEWLPGVEKDPRFDTEPVVLGTWSLFAGLMVFWLVWFFWAPQELVFLDRICINQRDRAEKEQGVFNIGACLKKHSKNLLVILDETYCQRLWCQFELAAFLKIHQEEAILVRPMSLTMFVVGSFLLNSVMWSLGLLLPYDSIFTAPLFVLGTCCYGWLAATVFLRSVRDLDLVQNQLQSFSFSESTCSCCSMDHKGPSGEELPCDREIIRRCVERWFGSMEEFEGVVQTRVKDALSCQLGGHFCPFSMVIVAGLPLLWSQMDNASAQLVGHDASDALGRLVIGLGGVAICGPLGVGVMLISTRCIVHCVPLHFCCATSLRKFLASAVSVCSQFAVQLLLQLCTDSLGLLPGSLLWAAVLLVPSVFTWRFARRLRR